MPAATAAPARHRANAAREALRCRVRLADGRVFAGRACSGAPPRAAARRPARADRRAGRARRRRAARRAAADHDPPARRPLPARRRAGGGEWLEALLALAARHADRGEEVFVAPAVRAQRARREARGQRDPVAVGRRRPARTAARAVGVPRRAALPSARRDGGEWWRPRLLEAGPAAARHPCRSADRRAGRADRARAPAADPSPRRRRGRQAERRRPGVRGALAGDAPRRHRQRQDRRARADPRGRPRAARLPDPAARRRPARPGPAGAAARPHASGTSPDPYKRIGPREYFERLAGIVVPRDGLVNCPAHEDRVPSCSVGTDASQGWRCHAGGCGARGAIYDLASVLLGGPWGPQLRGEAFKRARAYVIDAFGEPIGDHDGTASGRPGERSTR